MTRWLQFALLLCAVFTSGCGGDASEGRPALTPEQLARMEWDEAVSRARGSTVAFAMWAGDEVRNRHFHERVIPALQQGFGIQLEIIPLGDTAEAVSKLVNEKAAGRDHGGSIDLLWINGENFRTAKQAGALWGPFADRLPNIRYYPEAVRRRDFGTEVEGYEAPWGAAQFVIAYDPARVPDPPRSLDALREWVKRHPGRFTYLAPPDFTGSAFLRHILYRFGGGPAPFQSGFDERLYERASGKVFEYLNKIEPFLWNQGETYPQSPREQDRLFANGEIGFAMSYNPAFASLRIERGQYPPTVRTFVFERGTLGNYNYLAIPFNASNPAGALVTANYLISVPAQLEISRELRGPFAPRLDLLTPAERAQVEALPRGPATLPREVLEEHFLPEPDARYLDRLEKDWRKEVLLR